MDPQALFFLDKKVVRTDRIVSLFFSLALAALMILIDQDVITTFDKSTPIFIFSVVTFFSLGVIQLFWDPYTRTKVLAYNLIYAFTGALVCIFIIGFISPLVFLGWLMLIMTTTIYFERHVTTMIYGIFIASVIIWTFAHRSLLDADQLVQILFSSLFVGWIVLFVDAVWRLFNRSVRQLDKSRDQEKLERERLLTLVNDMADGVIATDEKGKVVLYNGAALNVLDTNKTLTGLKIDKLFKIYDKNNQKVKLLDLVLNATSQATYRDYRLKYADGSFINLYLSIAPVKLSYGQKGRQGFVLQLRDITREKSLEEERDEFISVVSHELRTPIAIAEGNVGNAEFIIKKADIDGKVERALSQAHSQILFLSDMINDLATLSRAERGKLTLEIESIDARALAEELVATYSHDAKAKGLELKSDFADYVPVLKSSRLYVREILQNFITNAIKYTEKGSVTVSVKPAEKCIKFIVEDTGIGISKADKERVFDKFFRSEDFRTRKNNGTGLGLYVTMKLARLINADIDFDSELNKGSTFTITIPNLK